MLKKQTLVFVHVACLALFALPLVLEIAYPLAEWRDETSGAHAGRFYFRSDGKLPMPSVSMCGNVRHWLTRAFPTAEAAHHGLFNATAVKACSDCECEAIKCSTLYGKLFDMDGASPNFKLLAHVINIHEHDNSVLASARLRGNHQVGICVLAGVDALNSGLLLSLTTVVNLFCMVSFFMLLLVSVSIFRHVPLGYTERATTTGVQFNRQGSWFFSR